LGTRALKRGAHPVAASLLNQKPETNEMTTPKDNGGPIASGMEIQTCGENSRMLPVGGMALRDWFAGMALQGMLSNYRYAFDRGKMCEGAADDAYVFADAMLAVRKEGV
jgi:hypothetical protein